ncbi:MAG: hypothetical protein AAFV53_22565 [Myxococcota bacterium]
MRIAGLWVWASVAFGGEPEDIVALRQQRMADSAPTLAASVYARALGGEMQSGVEFVPGIDSGKGWGVHVINLPITALWKAITDVDNLYRFIPVKHSQNLSGHRRTGLVAFQYLELPLVSDRWWCVQQRHNAGLYRSTSGRVWEMVFSDQHDKPACSADRLPKLSAEGMPVAWTRGGWMMVALGEERTLVEYHVWTDPGGSLPTAQASRIAAMKVRDSLSGIERMARWELNRSDLGFTRPDGAAY